MIFDQSEYEIRCEWGEHGVARLAPTSDVFIIVDVLSFSTAVEIATNRGAIIFPYLWKDETAYEFAASVNAEVADKKNRNGYTLSPASLLNIGSGTRLALPSPNGSTISLSTGQTQTLAGCLRNCQAVAAAAMKRGRKVSVIPAGERWEDGSLRPCFEDLAGAGAIISFLEGTRSPEAAAALAVYESAAENLFQHIRGCASGKEKLERGEEHDIELASALNASTCVPLLTDGAFVKETQS
jgi:2-phosphosulfolactate phosphatase